jgi:hypothetical protein
MTEVGTGINGWSADVEADKRRVEGLKVFLAA